MLFLTGFVQHSHICDFKPAQHLFNCLTALHNWSTDPSLHFFFGRILLEWICFASVFRKASSHPVIPQKQVENYRTYDRAEACTLIQLLIFQYYKAKNKKHRSFYRQQPLILYPKSHGTFMLCLCHTIGPIEDRSSNTPYTVSDTHQLHWND